MRNFSKRAAIVVSVPAIFVLAACGSNDPDPTAGSDTSTSPEAVELQESETTTPEPTNEQSPDSSDEDVTAVADKFEMPDLRGMILQTAQDTLQSLGSYLMDQEDASGLGRMQLVDANWQVCTQEPAAGSSADASEVVTLSVVKLDETCP